MSQRETRPGQATFAGWLIIGGSVVLVVSAWQRIAGLRTLEAQEELRRVLADEPMSGLGLSVDELSETIRVLSMVSAGAATAAVILGFYALRRSTQARLALSLLAPLVLVGGFATAGFFAPLVVAGVTMLWLRPTRDWFAGRPWTVEPAGSSAARDRASRPDPFQVRPPEQAGDPPAPPRGQQPGQQPAQPPAEPGQPGAQPGEAPAPWTPPTPPPGGPGPAATPYGARPHPFHAHAAPSGRRPGALVWACALVWAGSGLVAVGMLLTALVLAVARDQLITELERQQDGSLSDLGITEQDLVLATYVTTAVVVVWCAVAIVLAVLAFRRVGWARAALAISTSMAGVTMLLFAIVNPLLVVLVAAAGATTWLLLRPEVAAWFRR